MKFLKWFLFSILNRRRSSLSAKTANCADQIEETLCAIVDRSRVLGTLKREEEEGEDRGSAGEVSDWLCVVLGSIQHILLICYISFESNSAYSLLGKAKKHSFMGFVEFAFWYFKLPRAYSTMPSSSASTAPSPIIPLPPSDSLEENASNGILPPFDLLASAHLPPAVQCRKFFDDLRPFDRILARVVS